MKYAPIRKWFLRPLLALVATVVMLVSWNFLTANFATIGNVQAYRSAQMHGWGLAKTVRDHKIRTVLNLRGQHPEQSWYRAERSAALREGATLVDVALSSCEWMSRSQIRTLVNVLQTSEKPILIHCWRGSERTGIASAFLTLLRDGSTLDEARAQFSLQYLFIRAGDGVVCIQHLEQYESWLKSQGQAHTPTLFRQWVNEGFVPGIPSREQWPYDPIPLAVLTRSTSDGPVVQKLWDDRGRLLRQAHDEALQVH